MKENSIMAVFGIVFAVKLEQKQANMVSKMCLN